MKNKAAITSVLLAILVLTSFCYSDTKEKTQSPRNIILFIGDGMGMAQLYSGMTRNSGALYLERATHVGLQKTFSANNYITDSAASGTAMATGKKTRNGMVSVDSLGNELKTIVEYAEEHQYATGLVSTSAVTHATPASFIAHVENRGMYEDIASDFAESDVDVVIGGGSIHFNNRADSIDLLKKLKERGFQVVHDLEQISNIQDGKLYGFTAEGHPPSILDGRGDMLPVSTKTAINILSKNSKGFFLMVEGSQIDWAAHGHNTEGVISEMIDFDKAVKEAMDFAQNDGNTLVIVTADHETGGMSLVGGDMEKGEVLAQYGTGGHTAVLVPVFTYGPGADMFSGIYDNTDIFRKMMHLLGFDKEAGE